MSDNKKSTKIETRLVTDGRRDEWTHGIVNPPVYRASTCIFESYDTMRERAKDPAARHLYYGRKGTPTQWSLEEALTDLEGGAGTKLYPSGVAAVNSAILALVSAGDHVLMVDSAYEPTRAFARSILQRFGVETSFYDPMAGENIAADFRENTKLVVAESPGSLTFEVQDIPAIAAVCRDKGAWLLVDNTWATPLYCNPLALGADVSVHAVTKYIGGHSDLMMGSVTANERAYPLIEKAAFSLGQTASPDDAFLASRGLRTLAARLKIHEEKALTVARWLREHTEVAKVLHPAFEDCRGHAIWKRDFKGSTGLFSVILKEGTDADTAPMVDHMRLFRMGFSWGGYESLILPSNPAGSRSATHWAAPGPLLRLHIGLEDTDDLIADLADGLDRYRGHMARK